MYINQCSWNIWTKRYPGLNGCLFELTISIIPISIIKFILQKYFCLSFSFYWLFWFSCISKIVPLFVIGKVESRLDCWMCCVATYWALHFRCKDFTKARNSVVKKPQHSATIIPCVALISIKSFDQIVSDNFFYKILTSKVCFR